MFRELKTEHRPFLAFICCKGQIQIAYSVLQYMKALPYQFGLATISGFREHAHVTRIQINRNQLENTYLITLQSIFLMFFHS